MALVWLHIVIGKDTNACNKCREKYEFRYKQIRIEL